MASGPLIGRVEATAYTIPTDQPEADGTFVWTSTTLVVVEVEAGGKRGLGATYTDGSIVRLIAGKLAETLSGRDAMDPPGAAHAMQHAVRNMGREGLAATAISAIDIALWELKAKLLDLPLATLLGCRRDAVPIYGSGGFTTYDDTALRDQLGRWVNEDGCRFVKMKIGTHPEDDLRRVQVAKAAIGSAALFVDANGALAARPALALADVLAREAGVAWFEEPISSDDLTGLRHIRERAPAGMEIAAGEYAYTADYVRRMLQADAVDVQQADITRCSGMTGFLVAATLCDVHSIDLSGHCAPAFHLHAACAVPRFRHLEWFHDHVRIERMLFDGAPVAAGGVIRPDLSQRGLGLDFRRADAERYRV